ncbi:MAG TPA: ABC transporter permease, partial [Candidatus Sulfotelmatobacter sp.]|nr:ABC transporter permease [Candidatus Sulfotelmatobacter sp.]
MFSHSFRELRLRIQSLLHRDQLDRELDDELSFHVARRAEKNRAAGMDAAEAGYAAHRQLGNVTHVKERTREVRIVTALETIWRDIRFGVRMLLKEPAFTFIVILTLALGIGANTAIFSVINGLMLRPLPISEPQEVAYLAFPHGADNFDHEFSYSEFTEIGKQTSEIFSDQAAIIFGGFAGFENQADGMTVDGATQSVQTAFVTGNFFRLLGISPAMGRLIFPAEGNAPNADPVAVLSHRYWRGRFHSDPLIVGKKAAINGQPVTIVGVAPEGFDGITPMLAMEAYLPLGMATIDSAGNTDFLTDPKNRSLVVLSRWKHGVTSQQAQPALDIIGERLFQQNMRVDEMSSLRAMPLRAPGITNPPGLLPELASLFFILAGLVLLLACVNVANLMLVRAAGREREMAVRTALGASRTRVVRQLLTESVLLSVAGCVVGLMIGMNATRAISAVDFETDLLVILDFPFDWHVFLYATAIALAVGVFVGLFPALRVSTSNLRDMLHSASRGSTARRQRVRSALVAVQVGGSLALLIVAGLFLRSLRRAESADLGFEPRGVVNLTINPHEIGYDKAQSLAFYRDVLERIRILPGVQSASLASTIPLGETVLGDELVIPDFPAQKDQPAPHAVYNAVSSEYFETMGIGLLKGRAVADSDTENGAPVAVINAAMAEKFWPNQDPIGKHFVGSSDSKRSIEIVGIVRNARLDQVYGPFAEAFYLPYAQKFISNSTLQIRTTLPSDTVSRAALAQIHSIAPTMPVYGIRTMSRVVDGINGLLLFKAGAGIAGALGLLGLLLAVIGVYGVMSYSVRRRTSEIGIRMALGARQSQVLMMICKQGALLVGIGLLTGLVFAFAIGRLLGDFLVGVTPTDPITFAVVSILLTGVALLACFIPARR